MNREQNPKGTPAGENSLLAGLLATDLDLDEAFDRLFGHTLEGPGPRPFKVVIPGERLANSEAFLAELFTSVLAEYDEIDELLENLHDDDGETPFTDHPFADHPSDEGEVVEDAVAFVSDRELENPLDLERALAPLSDETHRFEVLFTKARRGLDRLDVYRLSRRPATELVATMRRQENVVTLQKLVEFLRTLSRAADSFEALQLPEPHIRDYLRHLYSMHDWQEMAHLVRLLEKAMESQPRT